MELRYLPTGSVFHNKKAWQKVRFFAALASVSVLLIAAGIALGSPLTEPGRSPNHARAALPAEVRSISWEAGMDPYAVDPLVITQVISEVKKLTTSVAQAYDAVGYSVALNGDGIVAGAPWEDGGPGDPVDGAGAVYCY